MERETSVLGWWVLQLTKTLHLFSSRAKNVVAAARPPVRFFSAEAPVVDLYLGQLDQARMLREHEQDVMLH